MKSLFLIVLLPLVVACDAGQERPEPVSASDGRTTTKPINAPVAQRIVSLAPNLTELAYQAGAGDKLVAAVEYSDYPPEAKELPRIGDAFRIDFERLRQLQPDLILVWESGNPKEMQLRIQEMGFPVLVLEPSSLEDVASHIRAIGEMAGTPGVANVSAQAYLDKLDKVFSVYGAEPSVRVFYQISAAPWYTVNADHVISDIISRCGGINVFSDLTVLAPSVSPESVVATDPEVIIASVSSDRPADDWTAVWRRFSGVSAVRDEQFISVNSDLISRSSTRLADGAEQLCRGLAAYR